MLKTKLIRLVLTVGGVTLAIGGCAGGGWLPLAVGAGLATLFVQQAA